MIKLQVSSQTTMQRGEKMNCFINFYLNKKHFTLIIREFHTFSTFPGLFFSLNKPLYWKRQKADSWWPQREPPSQDIKRASATFVQALSICSQEFRLKGIICTFSCANSKQIETRSVIDGRSRNHGVLVYPGCVVQQWFLNIQAPTMLLKPVKIKTENKISSKASKQRHL